MVCSADCLAYVWREKMWVVQERTTEARCAVAHESGCDQHMCVEGGERYYVEGAGAGAHLACHIISWKRGKRNNNTRR